MGAGGGKGLARGVFSFIIIFFFLLSFSFFLPLFSLARPPEKPKPPGIKATMSAPGAPRARRVNGAGARGAALPPSPRPSVTCGAAGPCERRAASPPPPPPCCGPGRAVGSGGNLAPCVCASERGRARVCVPLKWRGRPGGEMPRRVGGRRGPRCRRGRGGEEGGAGVRRSALPLPAASGALRRSVRGSTGSAGAGGRRGCRRGAARAVLPTRRPRDPRALLAAVTGTRSSEPPLGSDRSGPGLPRGSFPAGRGRAGPPEGSQPFCLSLLIGRLPAPLPSPWAYH